jgi:hypothetical protein
MAERITVGAVGDPETARFCAALRRRSFLATYGRLGLREWPGEPDRFDDGPGFLVAREAGRIVGTVLLRHDVYDASRPFWMEGFGVTVPELIPDAPGRRIGEVGRLAIDKDATRRPLDIAAALADAVFAQFREAAVVSIVATVMSAPMLAFYKDLVRRHDGGLRVHPRKGHFAGIDLTYMVLSLPEREFL